jgi:hypothetical protein
MNELEQLKNDKARLDWLEQNLRSTGRGHITLNLHDYNSVRVSMLMAHRESAPRNFSNENRAWVGNVWMEWPDTEGRATSLRDAIDAARLG